MCDNKEKLYRSTATTPLLLLLYYCYFQAAVPSGQAAVAKQCRMKWTHLLTHCLKMFPFRSTLLTLPRDIEPSGGCFTVGRRVMAM